MRIGNSGWCDLWGLIVLGFATSDQRINCGLRDVQYAAATDRFYGLTDSSQGLDGNALWVINPATLVIENKIYVGVSPSTLAISDNGTQAYVGFEDASEFVGVDLVSERVARRLALVFTEPNSDTDAEPVLRQPQFVSGATFGPNSVDNEFGEVQQLIYSRTDANLCTA